MTVSAQLHDQLVHIRHVALDMDGTIYRGSTVFPFARPFLEQLTELSIGYTFVTNNPSKSVTDYVAHLLRLGIKATPEQLQTTTQATIDELRIQHPDARRLFLLGTRSMVSEFVAAGFEATEDSADDEPDAVVVGFDTTLTFSRLGRAAWWVSREKPYLATNPDRVCPTDQRTILIDCGSICACIEHATGRRPDTVLGKPDPRMLGGIISRYRLKPHEIAMVGDRIYTDMLMARNAGALGVLVLTGECTAADAATANPAPDLMLPSVRELGELLASRRKSSAFR
jgi:NagD protein